MSLITLDFWGAALLFFFAGLLVALGRFIWWLAAASERLLALLTQTGLHGLAKTLLEVLIGYTGRTYLKSRFIVWNQARFRFALLWTGLVGLAGILFLFHQMRVVHSVYLNWLLLVGSYLGLRLFLYYSRPKRPRISTQEPSLQSLIQDVNEQLPPVQHPQRPVIRQYDYLDELFWESF